MNPPSDPREKLAQAVQATLRSLPPRRAPRSLEQRVLAEIARRAALPWWRQSFAHWPQPARAGLIVALGAVAALVLLASAGIMTGFALPDLRAAFAQPYQWMEHGLAVGRALAGFGDVVLRNIPPLWLYGVVAVVVATYATLFGLGAAAFKALRLSR
jgi:hypothetical protein